MLRWLILASDGDDEAEDDEVEVSVDIELGVGSDIEEFESR